MIFVMDREKLEAHDPPRCVPVYGDPPQPFLGRRMQIREFTSSKLKCKI